MRRRGCGPRVAVVAEQGGEDHPKAGFDLFACSDSRSAWVRPDPMAEAAKAMDSPDVRVADLTDRFCSDTRCPTVVGGVIVFFDDHHLTRTYSRSLAPFLEVHLSETLRSSD